MALAPGFERIDHRTQGLTDLGETIFHPRRYLGIDLSDDEPVVLKRAQLLGQHPLGDAGHPPAQFAKTLRARLQVEQDHALPLAVDEVQRRFDSAAWSMREISPFHAESSDSIQTGTISLKLQYLPTWCQVTINPGRMPREMNNEGCRIPEIIADRGQGRAGRF